MVEPTPNRPVQHNHFNLLINPMTTIFNSNNRGPQSQSGSFLVWLAVLLTTLIGLLFFSYDVGVFNTARARSQTEADTLALAGVNVIKKVFYLLPSEMTAKEKADYVLAAVREAAGRLTPSIADADLVITYCPISSEADDSGLAGGPCFDLPPSNSPPGSYSTAVSGSIPGKFNPLDYYPNASELTGGSKEDSAAYVHVAIQSQVSTIFGRIMNLMNFPPVWISATAAVKERDNGESCVGYFTEKQSSNDPQTISLKDDSEFEILQPGGLLITDDPNLVFSAAGARSEVTADWIKAVGANSNPNIDFTCRDGGTCPELGVSESLLRGYEPPVPTYPDVGVNCASTPMADTKNNLCDMYPRSAGGKTRWFYVNCHIKPDNIDAIVARTPSSTPPGPGCGGLCAGTYCGGLTIEDIPDAKNLLLKPIVSGGNVTDDVFYFEDRDGTEKSTHYNEDCPAPCKKDDEPEFYKEIRDGHLRIRNSILDGSNGGVANAGVYIYAPNASGSEFAVSLTDSTLGGSLILYSDHLYLESSTLRYLPYNGGLNPCYSPKEPFAFLVL